MACPSPDFLESPYAAGLCHVLAVALHRRLGWELVLALNLDADFWQDPEDPDNAIPEVVHAYAVDPSGMAWDIAGSRPADQIRAHASDCFGVGDVGTDWMKAEGELRTYVGYWADAGEEPIDRPLLEYTDEQVEQAWVHALSSVPGLARAMEPAPSTRAPRP